MNQHKAQGFGVSGLENRDQELDDVEVDILEGDSRQIENEADTVNAFLAAQHRSDGLDGMQDENLHGLGSLQFRIVHADLDDEDGAQVLVLAANVRLAGAVLLQESLLVRIRGWLVTDDLALLDNGLVDLDLIAPGDVRGQHGHGLLHVPLASPEETQQDGIWMVRQNQIPEALFEHLWRHTVQRLGNDGAGSWLDVVQPLDPAESEHMDPCLLQLAFFILGQIAHGAGLSFDVAHFESEDACVRVEGVAMLALCR